MPSVLLDGAESKTTVNATVYEHQHGTCDGDCLYVHRNDMLGARNAQRPLSAVQVFTEYPCRYADEDVRKSHCRCTILLNMSAVASLNMYHLFIARYEAVCKWCDMCKGQ